MRGALRLEHANTLALNVSISVESCISCKAVFRVRLSRNGAGESALRWLMCHIWLPAFAVGEST
jgi:hypothetical protein